MNIEDVKETYRQYFALREDPSCTKPDCQLCKMLKIESDIIAMFMRPDTDRDWLIMVLDGALYDLERIKTAKGLKND
jgi:hypothetical protein